LFYNEPNILLKYLFYTIDPEFQGTEDYHNLF